MKWILLFPLFFSFIGCTSLSRKELTFTYNDQDKLQGDLWIPSEKKAKYPVVITIHGGSWSSRTRDDMNKISSELSKNGFAVINMSYSLAPGKLFPAPIQNVKEVVEWVMANNDKYHLDVTRINLWGYSAGSQIATLAGLELSQIIPIRALVNGAGPMDLTKYPNDESIIQYLGGNDPELLSRASPVTHVTKTSPPVFTYHGKNDHIVDYYHATKFQETLNQNNVPNELYSVPLYGHLLTFVLSRESIKKAIAFLKKYN